MSNPTPLKTTNLTFQEALEKMKKGKKVTHSQFTRDFYLFLSGDFFKGKEEGEPEKFYHLDLDDLMATDWMVVE